MSTWVFDTETLPNRTLLSAKCIETGEWFDIWRHEQDAVEKLRYFIAKDNKTFLGFNSIYFDDVIVSAFCAGRSELEIKRIADDLIVNRTPYWEAYKKFHLRKHLKDHIDLIEVAPSFVGLKAYGSRMHMPTLQDMPLAHSTMVKPHEEQQILDYCHNDVDTTERLLNMLESEIMLRVEMSRRYGVDLRSKSDSQMAEQAYIKSMGLKKRENTVPKTIKYMPPAFLSFESDALKELLEKITSHVFFMNQKTGHVILPEFLGKEIVSHGVGRYQLGVGGIHSVHDKKVCYIADGKIMGEIDAASFYPSIIIKCGFTPQSLGADFTAEYQKIYTERLAAKASGDKTTSETLKISLNGTFGKLASRYSVLYSPDLMLAVTLTGQLTLLMLIERLEKLGVETLSANTDGIAVRYDQHRAVEVDQVIAEFSELSKFEFEFTPYRALAMKDVNNYIAVKPDRSLKVKGIYAPLSLRKNPTAQVCSDAVGAWLAHGVPLGETIYAAPFKDFISARNVTGGGKQEGKYLGKVVRWYQSTKSVEPIRYYKNDNKVPKSDGARACMTVENFETHPSDLDYDWYYKEAIKIAVAVGASTYLTNYELALIAPAPKKRKKNAA